MKCPNCGTEAFEGELFCTVCGSRLEQAQPVQPEQVAQQPIQQPIQQQIQQPVQAQQAAQQAVAGQPVYGQQQIQQPVQAQQAAQQAVAGQPMYGQQQIQQPMQPEQTVQQPVQAQQAVAGQPMYGQQQIQQPVQQPMQQNAQPVYSQQPIEPPKKKMKIWPIFLLIFLLIIAGGGVAAYMNKEYVVNAWRMNFSSPKDYYLWVEKRNADKAADKIANSYDEKLQLLHGDDRHVDVNLGLEMGESLFDIIGMAEDELEEFSFLKKIGIRSSVDTIGEKNKADTILTLDGQDIISFDVVQGEDQQIYFSIPELSQKYILMDSEEYKNVLSLQAYRQKMFEDVIKCSPDGETTKKLYKRYTKILYENYDKIDLTKSTILRVNDLGQKCAQIDVTIEREDVLKISDAMINSFETDADLKKIYDDYVQCIKDEYAKMDKDFDYQPEFPTYAEMIKVMKDGLEEAKARVTDDDLGICMSVYVDNKGNIIGREWKLNQNGVNESIRLLSVREKGQRAFEASAIVGSNPVSFIGQGQEINGKLNGHFKLEAEGIEQFDVETKDFDVDALEDGHLNGTFILRPTDKLKALVSDTEYAEMIQSATITMTSYMATNENRLYFDIDTKDEKFIHLSLEQFVSKAKEIIEPVKEDILTVSDDEGLKEYVKSIDFSVLNQRLEAIGISKDLMDELKEDEEALKREAER